MRYYVLCGNTKWPQKWWENDFWQNLADDSVYTLHPENFRETTLCCTISEINVFLHFKQKFKMAVKNVRKMIFGKKCHMTLCIPCRTKNFVEITLLCTVSKINTPLCFTQKFKMAANNGWKRNFGENYQITAHTLQAENFVKLFYLAPFLRY